MASSFRRGIVLPVIHIIIAIAPHHVVVYVLSRERSTLFLIGSRVESLTEILRTRRNND